MDEVLYTCEAGRIVSPIDCDEDVTDFWERGIEKGVRIGAWERFSNHYRVAKGELTIVTGIPSHGKSEFMDALLVNMARDAGMRFAIYSPENYPYQIHLEKLMSKYVLKPFHDGPTKPRIDKSEISGILTWMSNKFFFVEPHEDDMSLDAILKLFDECCNKQIDGVLIDPWNELESMRPKEMSETDYIGECLRKCRWYARHKNIAMWIVAHPQKPKKDEQGNYPVPTPYDINGSANWYNKADNCLCVYRNSDNSVDVHVQKIKFKIRGKLGMVKFNYDIATGCYTEQPINSENVSSFYGNN
jgi:twinkle protein